MRRACLGIHKLRRRAASSRRRACRVAQQRQQQRARLAGAELAAAAVSARAAAHVGVAAAFQRALTARIQLLLQKRTQAPQQPELLKYFRGQRQSVVAHAAAVPAAIRATKLLQTFRGAVQNRCGSGDRPRLVGACSAAGPAVQAGVAAGAHRAGGAPQSHRSHQQPATQRSHPAHVRNRGAPRVVRVRKFAMDPRAARDRGAHSSRVLRGRRGRARVRARHCCAHEAAGRPLPTRRCLQQHLGCVSEPARCRQAAHGLCHGAGRSACGRVWVVLGSGKPLGPPPFEYSCANSSDLRVKLDAWMDR
eukprot:361162-Chlamydomonas_euryale.AAC.3